MSLRTKLVASVSILAMSVPLVAAEGDDAVGTAAFEELSVEVVDGAIEVAGVATFGGETVVVAEDPAGDAAMPSVGLDLTTLAITQADETLTFEMSLADALPGAGAPLTGVVYRWPLVINGDEFELVAWPTNVVSTALDGTGPLWVFNLYQLTPDGFLESPVDGEFTGSSFVWRIPLATVGFKPGQTYRPFAAPRSAAGFSGLLTLGNDYDTVASEPFVIGGGATVTVFDADGEEIDEVDARVRRGEFSATVGDLEPGTYTVEVTTGYGDFETTETFQVTI